MSTIHAVPDLALAPNCRALLLRLKCFSTNFNFRGLVEGRAEPVLFIKYAKDYVRGFQETATLPRDRVDYEYEGFRHIGEVSCDGLW